MVKELLKSHCKDGQLGLEATILRGNILDVIAMIILILPSAGASLNLIWWQTAIVFGGSILSLAAFHMVFRGYLITERKDFGAFTQIEISDEKHLFKGDKYIGKRWSELPVEGQEIIIIRDEINEDMALWTPLGDNIVEEVRNIFLISKEHERL